MIAAHLGTEVIGHDDGSDDGMFDLAILYPDWEHRGGRSCRSC